MSVSVTTSSSNEPRKFEWTSSQIEAARTVGTNLLVSAGAGSGKTAVLAERCAALIAGDIGAASGIPVENLLVVTFTDAAAGEMKQRIADALRARLVEQPANGWIQRQLALIDTAAICTLHSFCLRELRRHFAAVDLDPLAPIMDEHEAVLLRRDATKQTLKNLIDEQPVSDAVLNLSAAYGGNSDTQLLSIIESLNGFLDSLPDPDKWVKLVCERYDCGKELPEFWKNELVRELGAELREHQMACESALLGVDQWPESIKTLVKWIALYQSALESWLGRLAKHPTSKTLDDLGREFHEFEFPNIPAITLVRGKEEPEKSDFLLLQERLKSIREKYFKDRLCKRFGQFSTADWLEGIQRTAPHVQTLLMVAGRVRDAYSSAKRELGVIDFADLEQFMLRLMTNDQNHVVGQLRDQFEYVLVDEFQDISPIQARIIECVSRELDESRPGNLFCVGDVKQSIYRFRLAEPKLFLERMARYAADGQKEGRKIDLQENFRTRHSIIQAVNSIFERILDEDLGGISYDKKARLKPGRTDDKAHVDTKVELCVLESARSGRTDDDDDEGTQASSSENEYDLQQIEREAYIIAKRIKELVQAGTPRGEIVILLRSMQPRAATLIRALARMGIPALADTAGGLFEALEIQDVLALLDVLDNPRQDIPLATVLRSPLLGEPLSDDELVEIRTYRRDVPFHEAVEQLGRSDRKSATHTKVCSILATIGDFREQGRILPLADLLWLIYERSGYIAFVQGLRDGAQRRANLERLHEYARRFGSFQRQGLARFLEFIAGLQDADKDLDPGNVSRASGDAVRVMTMHRSKGLEFPVVVVAELGKRFNLQDGRRSIMFDRRLGVAMSAVDVEKYITYPTLPQRLVGEAIVSESLAEELRVLYVALTRARDRLILVGTGTKSHLEELRSAELECQTGSSGPLPLLARRTAQCPLDWIVKAVSGLPQANTLFTFHCYSWEDMGDWRIDAAQKVEIRERLESFSRLGELEPPQSGAVSDDLAIVRRRLTTEYAPRALTRLPAVASASTLKRRWETRQDAEDPTVNIGRNSSSQTKLMLFNSRRPEFMAEAMTVEATDRGTWTHEFLQRLDLNCPCNQDDLESQLAMLVSGGVFTEAQAGEIDVGAIHWFFTTSVGVALKDGATRKYREWPFVIGVDPSRFDAAPRSESPDDILLVRGIIDCLFNRGDGWEIIDYKTDAVTSETIAARAAEYRAQLDIYNTAVSAAFGQPIIRRALVFLSPRQIVEV